MIEVELMVNENIYRKKNHLLKMKGFGTQEKSIANI